MESLNAFILLANFVLVPGITYGCQLALGALGVTLIYSILRFSNFAHGESMSFGTMAVILFTWALQSWGISFGPFPTALLAIPVGIVASIMLVLATDKVVYRFHRSVKASSVILMIASLGVMFFYHGLTRFIIGPDDRDFTDGERFIIKASKFKEITGFEQGLSIKMTQGITIIITLICVALLFWFLNKTKAGKSMRAYSDNENLALLSGINPDRVVLITWILVGILVTIAGTLYGLDKSYKPFIYLQLLLPIFAAAIVGGLGSPLGAVAGGFVIALSEVLVTFAYKRFFGYLLPDEWQAEGLLQLLSTDYKFAVSFTVLVIVLLVKPTGIFKGQSLL